MPSNSTQSDPINRACDYLGVKDDPRTCLAYASAWNYCHRANPPETVRLEHQRQYCLTTAHAECPVFRNSKAEPLPREIRGQHLSHVRRGRSALILPVSAIVLALAASAVWFAQAYGILKLPPFGLPNLGLAFSAPSPVTIPSPVATPSPLLPAIPPLFPSATSQPALPLPAASSTYSDLSPATVTPISTDPAVCGHELDQPFGPGDKLMIHKVGGGDSLNRFEILYHTSVKAIEGVNLQFRLPVPKETILIIPLDTTEIGDLPVFEPLQVSERNTPIETMAFKVDADLLAFEKYNGFDASCRDFIGWVVAPRERPAP
jgi:hypothetical protein